MIHDVDAAWEDLVTKASLVAEAGDSMVAEWQMVGRGKTTGAHVEGQQFVAVELRNGLAIRVHAFPTKAEALEAAGLSE
jgi:ketosteroid isomerase-like protein